MASKREAEHRHAQYYMDKLRSFSDLYKQGGENAFEAIAQLNQDGDQIQHALLWIAISIEKDTVAAKFMEDLGNSSNLFNLVFNLDQNAYEHIYWLQAALFASRIIGLESDGDTSFKVSQIVREVRKRQSRSEPPLQ